MKYCSKCSKQFDTTGNFCPRCGNQLTEVGAPIFCPNCGKKLASGVKFCDACGTSLNVDTNSVNMQNLTDPSVPEKRNKSKALFAGIAVLLIAAIGGGYFAAKNSEKFVQYIPVSVLNVLGIEKNEEKNLESAKQNGNIGNALSINGSMQNTAPLPPTPQPNPQPAPTPPYPAPIPPSSNVATPVVPTQDIYRYIVMKDQFDREIADLAKDINSYTASHKNFRYADSLISRGQNIQNRILMERNNLVNANVNNIALKNQLLIVIDTEVGRISGLVNGMMNSKNGGDYLPEFRKGTDAAYRFDDADAELKRMQSVYTLQR